MTDRIIKRENHRRGSAHPNSKLTEEQVREIKAARSLYEYHRREAAKYSAAGLALDLGVSRDCIHGIWAGQFWSHVHG